MAYRFIQKNSHLFGVRWLLRRLNICPNAYYNYFKKRNCITLILVKLLYQYLNYDINEKRRSFKKVNKEINFNQMLLLQFYLTRAEKIAVPNYEYKIGEMDGKDMRSIFERIADKRAQEKRYGDK